MSEIRTLGPVGLNPLGNYNSQTEYEKLDVVLYQGSSYVALKPVQGIVPTNAEYWQKLVSGGVGVDDIVDNLESNDSDKPLSAKQGKILNNGKIQVFDTVTLMKAANLKNGMTAQTLGYKESNDGYGEIYKIRDKEDYDIIDDNNIIQLDDNGLIAEKINKIRNSTNGIICYTKIEETQNDHTLMYSPDGINFYRVGETNLIGGDGTALYEINNIFYMVCSNVYRISKDLFNWSEWYTIKENPSNTIYCNCFVEDKENDLIYSYCALKYKDDILVPDLGGEAYYFKIVYQTGTINEDGTITFDQTMHDLLYINDESYIDPYVINDKVHGLVLAYKDEKTAKIVIRDMTDFTTIGNSVNITCPVVGVEAPQLVNDDCGRIVCYIDNNALKSVINRAGDGNVPVCDGFFIVANERGFYSASQMGLIATRTNLNHSMRHPGITNCSKHALDLIEKIGIRITSTNFNSIHKGSQGTRYVNAPNNSIIMNIPGVVWIITDGGNITVNTQFKEYPLQMILASGNPITWNSNSNIRSECKNKTYTPIKAREWLIVYPDANDCVSGTIMPWDLT